MKTTPIQIRYHEWEARLTEYMDEAAIWGRRSEAFALYCLGLSPTQCARELSLMEGGAEEVE